MEMQKNINLVYLLFKLYNISHDKIQKQWEVHDISWVGQNYFNMKSKQLALRSSEWKESCWLYSYR